MSKDITSILHGWNHEPDELQVRIVPGDDGRDKLQMRIDLGLIQMELDGRPDGMAPSGHESILDMLESRANSSRGRQSDFVLDAKDCNSLMREGIQYYHRYLAAFHLQRYDLVARDTSRNLRLFAFVVRHAQRQRDKIQFDQYRPYVTMMRARALALQSLNFKNYDEALVHVNEGISGIRMFLADYGQSDTEANCKELEFLLRWRRELENERTAGPIERLEEQLKLAVALEEFEEAARIRDQLRRLRGEVATFSPRPD